MTTPPVPSSPTPTLVSRRAALGGLAGLGLGALLSACSVGGSGTTRSTVPAAVEPDRSVTAGSSGPGSSSATSPGSSPASSTAATIVAVHSLLDDGAVVGVGMPIVLTFDPAPTDATAFARAARVTVDGKPADGAWHWSKPYAGEPIQAHYRTRDYWPANADIRLELPIGGLHAGSQDGRSLVYAGGLTSVAFRTGDRRVTRVDGSTERAVVEVNGTVVRTMKASLGKSDTPTTTGVKVVMQKGEDVPGTNRLRSKGAVIMQDVGKTYPPTRAEWSVRITANGEYLHAAPWNSRIGQISTSDGCTNLTTDDAKWFYDHARIGDVVVHSNTGGSQVQAWDGFADWNTPWAQWVRGGLLPA